MSVRSEDHLTTLLSAGYIASNCKDGSSKFKYLAQGICRRAAGPLACWDLGFESHRGHGYLSVVSVVCCQVEVSRGVLPTALRRCVWSRNIKNGCSIYIYNISRLRVKLYCLNILFRREHLTSEINEWACTSASWWKPEWISGTVPEIIYRGEVTIHAFLRCMQLSVILD